jgi:hypothetical protein
MKAIRLLPLVLAPVLSLAGSIQPGLAAGAQDLTCSGGTISPGAYRSITVTGACAIPSGLVTVAKDLRVVGPDAFLDASSDHGTLQVGTNVLVDSGATLVMGCSAIDVPPGGTCSPPADTIGGNLSADGALGVLVYTTTVGGNITVSGGGGGTACPNPQGPPTTNYAFFPFNLFGVWTAIEDNTVKQNISMSGYQACWFGVIRNTVGRNVIVTDNTNADPDATEIVDNHVAHNLICEGNSPAAQVGDSGGGPNTVGHRKLGECATL